MCNYANPGVTRANYRRPDLSDERELKARIAERRRWIRNEQAKAYPSAANLRRYASQLAGYESELQACMPQS